MTSDATPRTDAAYNEAQSVDEMRDHARTLERELNRCRLALERRARYDGMPTVAAALRDLTKPTPEVLP